MEQADARDLGAPQPLPLGLQTSGRTDPIDSARLGEGGEAGGKADSAELWVWLLNCDGGNPRHPVPEVLDIFSVWWLEFRI